MKNKVFLLIALIALGLLSSCGQNKNKNQKEDLSEFGTYYGDSDDPADEDITTNESEDAKFKVIYDYNRYVFVTTADGNSYYLYDDEFDYSDSFLAFYIVANAIKNESDAQKYDQYLNKVYDLPHLDNSIPAELKERFLKLYYDYKDKDLYIHGKGYGYQQYGFSPYQNSDYDILLANTAFRRYKAENYPGKKKFKDIPDGALMFVAP